MRPFTDVLRDMRRGRVVDAATEQLNELVRAVRETNKSGTLTLTLTIKPNGRGDNAIIAQAKVGTSTPKADLPDALFYADEDGNLLRDDPTQNRMFADTVDADGVVTERKEA